MQIAETILNVIRDRGERSLKLSRIYRQLFNSQLYLLAYDKLYRNEGAMTPGITEETVDGMSLAKIFRLIEDLRYERFHWTPVRRTYIPKKDGSKRPLGIPTWRDKLLQEVIRMLLEAYFEPRFSSHSHGFRPKRGCHTALQEIKYTCKGTKWFIEGDISKCFDSFDHEVLINVLRRHIDDERFIRLIENLLKAGYLEEWRWKATLSGAPQGSVLSPLLSNIYLNELDRYVDQTLLPEYTREDERRLRNPVYKHYEYKRRLAKERGDRKAYKTFGNKLRSVPASHPRDPMYRRLKYTRYADDFLLSFAGPKTEAEEIKHKLAQFLCENLKLELSKAKTLVTHARTEPARFLGYEIKVTQKDSWRDRNNIRTLNGEIALRVPRDTLQKLCARYKRNGKAIHRAELAQRSDFDIVARYQSEYRGLVQYYKLALNLHQMSKLRWIMATSMLKTLANKHKSTVNAMVKKYRTILQTEHGPMKGFKVVVDRDGKQPLTAEFGGIPLRKQARAAYIVDRFSVPPTTRPQLITRLLAELCELCDSEDDIRVHHIRRLADLKFSGSNEKPLWMKRMAALHRKTLVVCSKCHAAIHSGQTRAEWKTSWRAV